MFSQEGERQAGVENIFHQDDVPVAQGRSHVLDQLDFAGWMLFSSVTAHRNEIECRVQLDLPRQVAEEEACAFEHCHQHYGVACEIMGNLLAYAGDSRGDLLALNKNFHGGANTDFLTNEV